MSINPVPSAAVLPESTESATGLARKPANRSSPNRLVAVDTTLLLPI
jgi:hypothetical protein